MQQFYHQIPILARTRLKVNPVFSLLNQWDAVMITHTPTITQFRKSTKTCLMHRRIAPPLIFYLPLFCPSSHLTAQMPTFTGVTAETGIDFKHTDGRSGRFYFLEELGSGEEFFYYDNDTDVDIYFVNGADLPGFQSEQPPTNVLYRNDGDGTFTDMAFYAGVALSENGEMESEMGVDLATMTTMVFST